MGAITQSRRGRAPQRPHARSPVDWSSLFARDLVLSIRPGIERGYDPVSGRLPTVAGVKPTPGLTGLAGGFGSTFGTGTTADRMTTVLAGAFPAAGRTVETEVIRNGAGGGNLGRLFDKTNGSAGQFFNWWSTLGAIVYSFYAGGAEQTVSIPGTSATGVLLRVRVTHEYANGVSIINAWVNGVQTVFGTVINGTLIDAPTTPMTIGNRAADMARSWDGLIFYTLVWNRITPGEEVAVFDPAALERTPEPMLGNGASGVIADTALAGAAALRATAGGSLTTKIALSGAAGIQASAGGSLVTEIRLSGSAGVQATAAGVLTTSIALAGAAGQQSAASGSLLTGIALAGAAAARATASGSLDGGAAGLIGAAVARVSASGDLSTAISLAGAAALQSSASGTLAGSGVSLSGVAAGRSSVLGELSTAISLAGLAPARVSAAGVLATRVALSGSARLVASGVGNLGVGVSFTRAPAGPGYAPRRGEYQARPAQTGGRRPPAFEKAYR